jgi:hypothetical protein
MESKPGCLREHRSENEDVIGEGPVKTAIRERGKEPERD